MLICLLSFTCNYVFSVRRGFLFLLVLGMGCVILLWHSLGLPYNSFDWTEAVPIVRPITISAYLNVNGSLVKRQNDYASLIRGFDLGFN